MTEKYGEPWVKTGISDVSDTDGRDVSYRPEYAARIVACVNACAGLNLPDDVPAGALTALVAACRRSSIVFDTGIEDALAALEVRA